MNFELFQNIYYENLLNLYSIAKLNATNLDVVKKTYSRNNKYFQENLNFLINIKLFEINKNQINIIESKDNEFKELILSSIFNQPDYALCIKSYLLNFQEQYGEEYTFKPDYNYNNLTSHLRNFLITTKYIKNKNGSYIILDKDLLKKFKKKKFSPEQLKKLLIEQELIGLAAEKMIFNYEKNRIKKFGNSLVVDHISLKDVSAGYDIQSYEGSDKIFIEVKAVSLSNYKFHLSVLEYQTAINLKEKYYIYLLPVDRSKSDNFDINNLLRINDINKSILNNKISWKMENDGYIFSKN